VASQYTILVNAQINNAGQIQQQLNAITSQKPITINANVATGNSATDIQKVTDNLNKNMVALEGLQIRNKDAFKMPEVQQAYNDVLKMRDAYGAGDARIQDLN
jgi:hypothetical protein